MAIELLEAHAPASSVPAEALADNVAPSWRSTSGAVRMTGGFDERRGDPQRMSTVSSTFLFADIAGFTALTEAHGDEQAAELVSEFCAAVSRELPASGGTQVKAVGDALMLSVPDPAAAVLLGLRITTELMLAHGAPAVRVGLHHGSAVERSGDLFGAAVNLAARVSAEAKGGEVLLTSSTAALAPEPEGVLYEPRGRRELRNVREPVELFAAVRTGGARTGLLPRDPVCRMAVDPERAPGRLVHDEATYFFCSLSCAGPFALRPERFVR